MSIVVPTGYTLLKQSADDCFMSRRFQNIEEIKDSLIFSYKDVEIIEPYVNQGFSVFLLYAFTKNRKKRIFEYWESKVCVENPVAKEKISFEIALDYSALRSRLAHQTFLCDQNGIEELSPDIKHALQRREEVRSFTFPDELSGAKREASYIGLQPFLENQGLILSYDHPAYPQYAFGIRSHHTSTTFHYVVHPGKHSFDSIEEAYLELQKQINRFRLKGVFQ